jgi:hypothetical protein
MNSIKKNKGAGNKARLHFVIVDRLTSEFCQLLQHGFLIEAHVGCSVNKFLCEQIGVTQEYIQERIQSVFLDGKPVDDLDLALIRDGSRLALSAAMPGLVGASMRRGGLYSSLRSAVTYHEGGERSPATEGLVQMKLFNLLMKELGPSLLRGNILLKSSDLVDFFEGQSEDFWQGCSGSFFNGKPVDPDLLRNGNLLIQYELVDLSIDSH